MAKARTGLVFDKRYEKHDTGPGHPEKPERIAAIIEALTLGGLTETGSPKSITRIVPRPAAHDDAELCHTRLYVEQAEKDIKSGARTLSTGDTQVSAASLDTAYLALGGVLQTVDALFRGEIDN